MGGAPPCMKSMKLGSTDFRMIPKFRNRIFRLDVLTSQTTRGLVQVDPHISFHLGFPRANFGMISWSALRNKRYDDDTLGAFLKWGYPQNPWHLKRIVHYWSIHFWVYIGISIFLEAPFINMDEYMNDTSDLWINMIMDQKVLISILLIRTSYYIMLYRTAS